MEGHKRRLLRLWFVGGTLALATTQPREARTETTGERGRVCGDGLLWTCAGVVLGVLRWYRLVRASTICKRSGKRFHTFTCG